MSTYTKGQKVALNVRHPEQAAACPPSPFEGVYVAPDTRPAWTGHIIEHDCPIYGGRTETYFYDDEVSAT